MEKLHFVYLRQAGERNLFTSFSQNLGPTFKCIPVSYLTFSINVLGALEGFVEYLKSYFPLSTFIRDTAVPPTLFPGRFKVIGMAPK